MHTKITKGVNNSKKHVPEILLQITDMSYKYFDFRIQEDKKQMKVKPVSNILVS